jgi:hypothetical protein
MQSKGQRRLESFLDDTLLSTGQMRTRSQGISVLLCFCSTAIQVRFEVWFIPFVVGFCQILHFFYYVNTDEETTEEPEVPATKSKSKCVQLFPIVVYSKKKHRTNKRKGLADERYTSYLSSELTICRCTKFTNSRPTQFNTGVYYSIAISGTNFGNASLLDLQS